MKNLASIALFLNFCVFAIFAQTPQEMEQTLLTNLKEIQKYSSYGDNSDYKKLFKANRIFETNLLKYTKTDSTLKYDFKALNDLMLINTSEDGNFRVYSWDSESGGTMHDYYSVYQFRGTNGNIYSKTDKNAENDGSAGSFVNNIFQVFYKNEPIYIICSTFIGSTSNHYQSADLVKINRQDFESVKLIKTSRGLTDTLSFEYNFFSVVDRKERPIRLIKFDKKTQILSIPVVIEDKEFQYGRVTNRFINYKFNGKYFVKSK